MSEPDMENDPKNAHELTETTKGTLGTKKPVRVGRGTPLRN